MRLPGRRFSTRIGVAVVVLAALGFYIWSCELDRFKTHYYGFIVAPSVEFAGGRMQLDQARKTAAFPLAEIPPMPLKAACGQGPNAITLLGVKGIRDAVL